MDFLTSSAMLATRELAIRSDDKSFWDKYKWLIIGAAIAIPIQLVAGFIYLRYRKKKKAAAARQMSGEEGYAMPGRPKPLP